MVNVNAALAHHEGGTLHAFSLFCETSVFFRRQILLCLWFCIFQANAALRAAFNDVSRAASYLMEGIPDDVMAAGEYPLCRVDFMFCCPCLLCCHRGRWSPFSPGQEKQRKRGLNGSPPFLYSQRCVGAPKNFMSCAVGATSVASILRESFLATQVSDSKHIAPVVFSERLEGTQGSAWECLPWRSAAVA